MLQTLARCLAKDDFKHLFAIGKSSNLFEDAIAPGTLRKFLDQYSDALEIIA